ncbi:MAG TPA: Dabb family protein [Panacibacter sp.]|nr:Dabb family protein [Panacibacter sp.]HNP46393.1 Dabb family protein [Panacibacter sp.]
MKKILLTLLILFSIFIMANAQNNNQQQVLRHVVMFGWKEGTDSAYIGKIVEAFKALPGKIPLIKAFEWGTNNSPEGLNQGLKYCFFVTFTSEADRDAYLVDPAHKAFVALLKPAPEKVTVLDYWAQQ